MHPLTMLWHIVTSAGTLKVTDDSRLRLNSGFFLNAYVAYKLSAEVRPRVPTERCKRRQKE